ncbi:beta-alanyl-L-histidine (L-carnosine) dipeptidase PepD [Psychroflexus torquis ATCC 700755]|uniref:Cytosol non-specific dipeptidase n=1 Tax=Psychroflexus torquis (strain ATCC 700755 / CIP 106069 / ACAM 623) TaxID=313595 RepID=K4IBL3_PSYTT|nr:aminoacyl-histidine dipeptidase [Psychroflexus torquis]AFU67308.1 beta-alanyl-L-histidine (L-carnosine) dipeptidase PepD [Psychroflexus torquis ATCC 700755]
MSTSIKDLEPKAIWKNFSELNAVPRASNKEEQVIQFVLDFGKRLGLDTQTDKIGNVIIKKSATKGMEDRKTTVLQSHLDMVHQKNNATNFDFSTEGIRMHVDGDWVKADGTTLGADNGLGVATIMAILESQDVPHPALEALFTIDEETGMTGAKELDDSILKGDILLNLDTEEDDEIGIGCAGGVDLTATRFYIEESIPEDAIAYSITINGLQGGHSGMDIIKGLANANVLMNRILYTAYITVSSRMASIEGGGLRNAIPRESHSTLIINKRHKKEFDDTLESLFKTVQEEYKTLEPQMAFHLEETELPKKIMSSDVQDAFLKSIYAAHNGVYRMSPDIDGLVETSNNIARISVADGKIEILCLTRSSVDSSKDDLVNSLSSAFDLAGFQVELSGDYPGWTPNPDSDILKIVDRIYQDLNHEKANVAACHAGLECGILGSHYPKMDMISFGPTIRGAHSPDERASISSTQKFWKLTQEVLKQIPKKD